MVTKGKGRLPGKGGVSAGLSRMCRTKGQNMLWREQSGWLFSGVIIINDNKPPD